MSTDLSWRTCKTCYFHHEEIETVQGGGINRAVSRGSFCLYKPIPIVQHQVLFCSNHLELFECMTCGRAEFHDVCQLDRTPICSACSWAAEQKAKAEEAKQAEAKPEKKSAAASESKTIPSKRRSAKKGA